jgi:RHS repeat-associated protein
MGIRAVGVLSACGRERAAASATRLWPVAGRVRRPLTLLVCLLSAFVALAVSAVACEGTGGPPSSPTGAEQEGAGPNPGAPKVAKCEVGKPVDCATGNEAEQETDISIEGRGPGLRVVRIYDGLTAATATEAGPWGFGWTGPYDANLALNSKEGTATVHQENGSAVEFYKSGETYTQGGWDEARLTKEGTNYIYTLPDQTKLEFNSEGRLTKETERNGNSNTFTYNESHQLEKVTDGDSRTLTFKYKEGLVESVTDPMGHVVSYTYSEKQLASVTIEGKTRWKFEYESPHLLTKITDGREHSITIKYEATTHRVNEETQAGHTRKWKYGTDETTLSEPNGSETIEKFNSAGEPTKTTRKGTGVEMTIEYEYNAETYNLSKLTDPNGHKTEYGYDSEANKTSEKEPTGDEHKWTYDKKHDIETETTPEGETTTIKRNSDGDAELIERPAGSETQKTEFKYGEHEDLTEEINPLGGVTKYTYNAAGDKETEKDPEGDERKWKYNADSQVIETTSARAFVTEIKRNEQGRPTEVTDPLKHTTEYTYDGDDNLASETDGNGHTTKYEYNEENLPIKVEEPNKVKLEMEYDSEGELSARKDGDGHKWEYKHNPLEQITEEKSPLGKIWKKTYEKAGNLEKLEDPEKHTAEYTYDEANRLKKVKYSTSSPSEVTFEYNKDSKVKKMTDETGTTENVWDKLDRLTEYKDGAGKIVKYKYNLDNEPSVITYPGEKEVVREYDKGGRLVKVKDWNKHETSFKYNADSQLAATIFPSGTEDEDKYEYNHADQMSEVVMLKGKTELGKLVYERDDDGQVKKTSTSGLPGPATVEDVYDENNRLKEADKLAFEYDDANNPTKLEGIGPYTYNEADELTEGPEVKYAFDEDGQRTESKPTKGPVTSYGYDQAGDLTAVKRPEEGSVGKIEESYTYDGTGLRQTQTISGAKSDLTWDTAEAVPVVLSDETNDYIYGPENLPIEQVSTAAGETTLYLHHDQQGSTRLLTSSSGATETAYTYDPFGALSATTGTASTPLRYDGQYTSIDSGLIYLRARVYDPSVAQFLSVDPALETTGEPYVYGGDNPLNASDPSGLNSYGVCGQGSGNLGPVETGFSICSITSVRDAGVTISIPAGVALDVQMLRNIANWIRGRGPAGIVGIVSGSVAVGALVSNARSICQFSGPFRAQRGSVGWGPFSGSVERFWDANNVTRGSTWWGSYTWSTGRGPNAGGADGVSFTVIAYSWLDGLCP